MRASLASFLFLVSVLPVAADDIDQATRDAVFVLATRGYSDPGAAEIRNIHKSRARNGRGFCGEVTVEGEAERYTVFHAILEEGASASVIRLIDYEKDPAAPNSVAVVTMLRNFGCSG